MRGPVTHAWAHARKGAGPVSMGVCVHYCIARTCASAPQALAGSITYILASILKSSRAAHLNSRDLTPRPLPTAKPRPLRRTPAGGARACVRVRMRVYARVWPTAKPRPLRRTPEGGGGRTRRQSMCRPCHRAWGRCWRVLPGLGHEHAWQVANACPTDSLHNRTPAPCKQPAQRWPGHHSRARARVS